jgi:hypothetical protein
MATAEGVTTGLDVVQLSTSVIPAGQVVPPEAGEHEHWGDEVDAQQTAFTSGGPALVIESE